MHDALKTIITFCKPNDFATPHFTRIHNALTALARNFYWQKIFLINHFP